MVGEIFFLWRHTDGLDVVLLVYDDDLVELLRDSAGKGRARGSLRCNGYI